jgi:dipeptidyl aminopeptidase/acylaminoacyl peptidase
MILPHDRDIAMWLAEGPVQGPPEPLARALAATRGTRKRPRWTFPERWLPMQLTLQRPLVPRTILYLAAVALLLALVVAMLAAGAGSGPEPRPLGMANGVIAYDSGGQLFVADADGSNPRPLGQPGKHAYSPAFSPDGTRVAYMATNGVGQLDVYVANADGSDAHVVSQVPFSGPNKFPPVWSPEGDRLVYQASDGGVWVVAADGSSQERIAEGWSTAWSPDGRWIAFRSDGSGDARLQVIHPDGSGVHTLTTGDPNTDAFATIRWTPDSTRVVFHRDGVWTVDLDGNLVHLSPDGGYPTVSPDGRWVAFFKEIVEGTEELRLVELATGEISTLSSTGGCLAVWAPDSTAVVTYAHGCFTDLQRIPLDDPSAALTLDLASDIDGFPGWQGIAP